MRPTRWGHIRSTLASLLVVLLSISPGAMTLAAGSTAAPTAAHHHGPSGSQHHHVPAGHCCDLCVASCLACGAVVSDAQPIVRHALIAAFVDRVTAHGRIL